MNAMTDFSRLPRQDIILRSRDIFTTLLPALFLGRLCAEAIHPEAALPAAIVVFLLGAGVGWWLHRRGISPGLWALLLLPVVIFPYQSPQLMLGCGVLFATAWVVSRIKVQGWAVEAAVFVGALFLFSLTLAPGIQPADAGEFQLVLAEWGVAHPPGYALYSFLGGLFTHLLPLGSLADRANLFSGLAGALTLAVLCRAVRQETGSGWAGLAAAGILGTAASFWTTATQASIRPMTALFMALMIEGALAYRRAIQTDHPTDARWAIIRFGLAAGFGVTHHASLLFAGGVLALAVAVSHRMPLRRQFRLWILAVVAALAGTLPWLYLLARGAAGAPLAPPNLTTWSGFWQHVLASGFAGDMFYYRTGPAILERLQLTGQVISFQWADLILWLGVLALGLMLWRDRWLLLALGGGFGLHTLVAATYRAPQTVEYMIPAYVCLAAGIGWALGRAQEVRSVRRLAPLAAGITALAIVWSGWPVWLSLRAYQWRDHTAVEARALLAAAPPESAILANWHALTPLMVLQQTEGQRPDVDVRYVAPNGDEPILDTWARRIATESTEGPLVTCSYYPEVFRHTGLTFSAIATCWQTSALPDPPPEESSLAQLDDGLAVYVGTLPADAEAGNPVNLWLTWRQPSAAPYGAITTFVHLVDTEDRVLAQNDQPLHASGLEGSGFVTQRYALHLPRTIPPGRYRLLAGAYRSSAEGPVPLTGENNQARTAIGSIQVHAAGLPPVTAHAMHTPAGSSLLLLGFDYDLSVAGRARLYLHWQVGQPITDALQFAIHTADDRTLVEASFAAVEAGFITSAYDLPDFETVNGLWITLATPEGPLWTRGAWNFPLEPGISLPGPAPGDRFIMLGDVVVVDVKILPGSEAGESVDVSVTMRSTTSLTQDMSYQLSLGSTSQSNGTPLGGTIPTLKWGWNSVITDTMSVAWPPDVTDLSTLTLTYYDAFTSEPWPVFDPVLAQDSPRLPLAR